MRKTINEEFEGRTFQRHLPLVPAEERDTDDYEDFDDSEIMTALWHQGEEASEDELMRAEDY